MTREQLNELDKSILIDMLLRQEKQIETLTLSIEHLSEQIALMNMRSFSRSSEKGLTDHDQISMYELAFNEAEAICDMNAAEPSIEEVIIKEHTRKKRKGKREEDLSGFPVRVIEHEIPEEDLKVLFPEGYQKLPDEVYKKLEIHPATFEVIEHHVAVYKGKDGTFRKAPRPKEMLDKSIASESLVSAVINAKFVNALPYSRQEQEYKRNDVNISRQTMANWVITVSERYLSLVYDRMKEEIKRSHVIHADETPVTVVKDGREGIHKSYMWVYRTGEMGKAAPAILYDYQKTRKQDAPEDFLKGFKGKLVCDGYQAYHGLEKRSDDIEVAGCWVHARRPFAEVVKSTGEEKARGTAAYEALAQIQNIYRIDNLLKKLPPSERKRKRKSMVKPLVDGFFQWAKEAITYLPPSSKTADGLRYCINQEKYLRTFLNDPEVPLDNNPAERAIRPFCVGKKNWNIIDSIHGAEASAIVYSLTESAKANDLKPYEYIKHLLTEIPEHIDGTDLTFLDDLLPWSEALPEECRKKKK